jgi:tetratricopeptide (TPR) repeat protein
MLFRLEIFVFLLSFFYSIYYVGDSIYQVWREKKIRSEERERKREEVSKNIEKQEKKFEKEALRQEKETQNAPAKVSKLSSEDLEKLRDLLKRVQLNKTRGYYDTARSLVVEWLAIDKNHDELNLELAEIYELENKYINAEFIYRGMIQDGKQDSDILVRLGKNLSLQEKISDAVGVYKQVHEKRKDDTDVLEFLSFKSFEVKNFTDALKYAKMYLKHKPRNPDILGIKWYCLEKDGKISEAIESYHKIIEVQPYNNEIKDRIRDLSHQNTGEV